MCFNEILCSYCPNTNELILNITQYHKLRIHTFVSSGLNLGLKILTLSLISFFQVLAHLPGVAANCHFELVLHLFNGQTCHSTIPAQSGRLSNGGSSRKYLRSAYKRAEPDLGLSFKLLTFVEHLPIFV